MSEHKSRSSAEHRSHASSLLSGAGYATKGEVKQAFRKHDEKLHGGKKTTPSFAKGGAVGGKMGKRGPKVAINIHTGAGQMEKQQAMKAGVALGAKMAAAKLAGGAPGGGAMPPGPAPQAPMPPQGGAPAGPMKPPGMMAKGGAIKYGDDVMEGGSASGVGRIDKAKEYGQGEMVKVKGHSRRHPSRYSD